MAPPISTTAQGFPGTRSPQTCSTTTRRPTQKARCLPRGFEGHPESGRNFSSTSDPVIGQVWPLAWDPKFRPHTRASGSCSSFDVPSSCRTFPHKRAHGGFLFIMLVTHCPSQGTSER